MRKNIKLLFRN